jgi:hypothetical protein
VSLSIWKVVAVWVAPSVGRALWRYLTRSARRARYERVKHDLAREVVRELARVTDRHDAR